MFKVPSDTNDLLKFFPELIAILLDLTWCNALQMFPGASDSDRGTELHKSDGAKSDSDSKNSK